jgi:hypothetical protein
MAKAKDISQIQQGEHRSVLSLRKTEEGLRVDGEAPDVHLLAMSFIERNIADGSVDVLIRLKTVEGDADVVYRLAAFELDDAGNPNRSSWIVEKVEG